MVVVEGHSKASNVLTLPEITAYAQDPILNRPLRLNSEFIAGLEMNRYLFESGATQEQCAQVVVKNRRNALDNPRAPYSADMSVDDVLNGPTLSWPLGAREASTPADGAVVMVLCSEERLRSLACPPVWILGIGWSNGSASLESRSWGELPYLHKAARMAYDQVGISSPRSVVEST